MAEPIGERIFKCQYGRSSVIAALSLALSISQRSELDNVNILSSLGVIKKTWPDLLNSLLCSCTGGHFDKRADDIRAWNPAPERQRHGDVAQLGRLKAACDVSLGTEFITEIMHSMEEH